MATRPELLPGGVLFETRRLYTETINNVLDRMHFIFNSQQHTIAAQKVNLLRDGVPPLQVAPGKSTESDSSSTESDSNSANTAAPREIE